MFVTSAIDILENCVLEIEKLSEKSESPPISSFPNLPAVTEEEVAEMQTWMSMNKGVTFDGFSDNWFRNSNQKILTNWWNNQTISQLFPLSFEAHLIPLNKAHSNISNKQQTIQTDNHSEQLSEMVVIKIQKTSPKISQLKN